MQRLERVHLVQFFLFEAQSLALDPTTAIIAPNGAGKSALLDALQIVLLGADRSRIRFNAQAGGSARARSIRDYCLGVFRSGEDGRKRRTATTYISLVFRDEATGEPLTAGVSLGASADEPEHRVHGLYLLPGVDLSLDEHLETVGGRQLPLAWPAFRELAARRCKAAGSKAEIHAVADRFVKDLLHRLRPSPTAHLDANAYRKAFQNALNLQRVDDVDIFVRTLVAEDRPTDVQRFRAVLETFRLLKEKIEQVARRIEAAEAVEGQYAKVAAQAVRAASYRALAAEYERDQLGEQVDAAGQAVEAAQRQVADTTRALAAAKGERDRAREAHEHARKRLEGSAGYGEQASFEQVAGRDREALGQLKQELLRQVAFVRDQLRAAASLELPGLEAATLSAATAPWSALHDELRALAPDADLPWTPEALHVRVRGALDAALPVLVAVAAHARQLHATVEQARQQRDAARRNQSRLAAGQAELREDVMRLVGLLQDAGVPATPVCDLVRVADPAWQPAIEAYLRPHVEALLVRPEHEEAAVRLYRSLKGPNAIYGVKLALASQARRSRGAEAAPAGSVAALIEGKDADAVAYLRRQLGEMACVETEAELVRTRHALSRDGLVSKGGGIERLRLPAARDLKIGAADGRDRARVLHEELDGAERTLRRLEPQLQRAEALHQALATLADPEAAADALHARALQHRQAEARYRLLREQQDAALDPDLVRLAERVQSLAREAAGFDQQVLDLSGQLALANDAATRATQLLEALRAQEDGAARRAVAAFAHPDVDPARVERQRDELDERHPTLQERRQRCEERAREADATLARALPEAWSQLAQYAKDHGLVLDFDPDAWREARAVLERELARLRETELVQYQSEADQAYATAVETFRSNVASALYDNFSRLREQINTLNRTLRASPAFSNNERYQFHYEVAPEYRELHRFIQRAADLGGEDGLFGSAGELPQAFRDLIEERAGGKGAVASPLDDYRRFFSFEVQIRQDDRVVGTLSERMRSGSGGEHRAPLYVIAGAALAAAYGKTEGQSGGLGLILLDEFGDKIDAQNARATTNYLRSLGLQLVLAAPDTAQGTLSGVLDSYLELFRDGDLLQVERIEVTEAGRALLQSDQFDLHPELLAEETARIAREVLPG